MSIRVMGLVWEIDFPTHSQKLIALKLADYASDNGSSVFPAVNTISRHTGSDERTVQRVMKAFRSIGLIELVKEGGTGPKSTNQWQLNLPLMVALYYGDISIKGSAAELEIDGEAKGDILSAKGDILSVDDLLRVTKNSLRAASCPSKGGSDATQLTNNHQLELPARERASAPEAAPACRAEAGVPILFLRGDATFQTWINWLNQEGHFKAAGQMASEGKLVAYAVRPFKGCALPILAPLETSPKYAALMAARSAVKPVTDITNRMLGEVAE